jgi:hypothetical protein
MGRTSIVKDINPAGNLSVSLNKTIVVHENNLYFSATNNIDGLELWKSDGTFRVPSLYHFECCLPSLIFLTQSLQF